jgi:hypothetical protein
LFYGGSEINSRDGQCLADWFGGSLVRPLSFAQAHSTHQKPTIGKSSAARYRVTVISCSACHTPGGLLGKPEMNRYFGGSEVGFALPGLGVFYGSNPRYRNRSWQLDNRRDRDRNPYRH